MRGLSDFQTDYAKVQKGCVELELSCDLYDSFSASSELMSFARSIISAFAKELGRLESLDARALKSIQFYGALEAVC